jgi:peptide/nickel transport system substrate-binding protein
MHESNHTLDARVTRRAMIAGGAALLAGGVATIAAQTHEASPGATPAASSQASPMASPAASPAATPVASPAATPVPDYPLDIYHADDLPDDGEPIGGGTLRLPVNPVALLEFVPPTQRQDPQVGWSYLDGLVRIDPATGTPAPGLATSWKWSADGLTLTFTLRSGVKWHDGSDFTAEDARFSHLVYRDDYRSVVAGQTSLVADVVAQGKAKLRVEFSEPDGAWLFNVASLPVFQRKQYRAQWEANPVGERTLDGIAFRGDLPVGTGPWKLETAGLEAIALSRNDAYWDTPPHAKRLELIPEADAGRRLSRWQDGDLQIVGTVDPQRVGDLLQTTGRLVVSEAPRTLFAAYNFNNPTRYDPVMLAELPLRQALSLALDRQRYAEEIWGGFLRWDQAGIVAQAWADAGETNPKRDVKRAKKLLKDANWADLNGDGILDSPIGDALSLNTLVLDSAAPAVHDTLEAMNKDLSEIGVSLTIESLPLDQFIARWSQDRSWDLLVYDLRLYPAFAEFDLIGSTWDISTNAGGWNPGGYANTDADAAIQAYFDAVSEKDLKAALQDLQRAIVEDPFALWLGFPEELVLVGPDVRGFTPNPLWSTLDTRTAWLAEE